MPSKQDQLYSLSLGSFTPLVPVPVPRFSPRGDDISDQAPHAPENLTGRHT